MAFQVYSSQPRIVKYAQLAKKRAVDGKLNQVVTQLEGLTQHIWDLSADHTNANPAYVLASVLSHTSVPDSHCKTVMQRRFLPGHISVIITNRCILATSAALPCVP